MGKKGKCYNILNGLINGATVWFSAPLYIGGCPNLHHTFGLGSFLWGAPTCTKRKPFTVAMFNF